MPETDDCDGIQIVRGAPDNATVLSITDALAKPQPHYHRDSPKHDHPVQPMERHDLALADVIRRVIYGRLSLALDTSVDDVAKVFGLSTRSLRRHLATGRQTFSSIVEGVKVAEAKRLLAETDLPITEIADSLKYGHLPSFTRAFRRSTGSTPSEIRKSISAD